MSCGTPGIAWRAGSAPEVVDHGVTGWIVDSIASAVEAVKAVHLLDRHLVRQRFEQRFSAEQMARQYLKIYSELAERRIERVAA
jgi:glycosyltransferase involved in cell wall biosynthesis